MNLFVLIGIAGLLAEPAAAAPLSRPAGPELAPYIVSGDAGGYVDWLEGRVVAIGHARIFRDIARSRGYYEENRKTADLDGQAKVTALLLDLPRDGGARLRDDAALMEKISDDVRKSPRGRILSDTGKVFEVDVSFPLWGEGSILAKVLAAAQPPSPPPGVTTASMEGPTPGPPSSSSPSGGAVTGLIIDVRQVERPAAALLPRVIDDKGRLVHGLETAGAERALQGGLVVYTVADPRMMGTPLGARQGTNPIVVRAQAVAGATRADLVISTEDADRVLKAAASSSFLKECRVVVLMPPPPPPRPRPAPRRDVVAPPAVIDPKKQ